MIRDIVDASAITGLRRPTRDFFDSRALDLAPRLLGMVLAHVTPEGLAAGRITETEAYEGPEDRACHAFGGRRTARTEVMFGPPGFAYVYFTYGMHWMFNVVACSVGSPHAVLVRSLEPVSGIDLMERRRRGALPLAEGPGRLAQAMAISGSDNGKDLITSELFIAFPPEEMVYPVDYRITKRIGVENSGEAKDYPWRFVEAR
ncbi:MAG: DNA-3-methyladenine glycosylase [Bacillota bacterium]